MLDHIREMDYELSRKINLSSFQLTSPALKDRSTLILSLRDIRDRLPRQGLPRVARYFSAGSRDKRAMSLSFTDRHGCNRCFAIAPEKPVIGNPFLGEGAVSVQPPIFTPKSGSSVKFNLDG